MEIKNNEILFGGGQYTVANPLVFIGDHNDDDLVRTIPGYTDMNGTIYGYSHSLQAWEIVLNLFLGGGVEAYQFSFSHGTSGLTIRSRRYMNGEWSSWSVK